MIGHEGVVKLLLERKDTNPNTPELKYGYTPLLLAVVGGHEGVVKLLLGREGLNPDIPGLSGETALELAVFWGYVRVLQLLSEPNPPLHNLESPLKPLPPNTRLHLTKAILFFVLIPLIFLFYSLPHIGPSLSAISQLPFHR